LKALGLPRAQQNERSSLTLLALAGVGPKDAWKTASRSLLRTVDIMEFMRSRYKKDYAPNTRETIRRQTLHQFIEARVADLNPDDPSRPTNSGYNKYALSDAVLEVLKQYGTPGFRVTAKQFVEKHGALAEEYRKTRDLLKVPVTLPGGVRIHLSAGEHNRLQKAIVEEFAPRFPPGAVVLYVGDTALKHVVLEAEELARLSIRVTEHEKLPDVIMYSAKDRWLFLVEAVTSHGPMTPLRLRQLRDMLQNTTAGLIYITAFLSREDFKRYASEIAWETEVWIADDPDHLIHFDGRRFLGPYAKLPPHS